MDLYVIHVIFGASELIQGAAAEQGYKQLFPTHRMRSSVVQTGDLKFHFTLPLTEIASQIACLINGPLQKDRLISIAHSSETEKKIEILYRKTEYELTVSMYREKVFISNSTILICKQ